MSMNDFLSAYYGVGDQSVEQDAQMEFFAKTAAQNGIDLSQLSSDQINYLWDATFSKTAEDEETAAIEEIVENMSDEEKAELLEELEKEEVANEAAEEIEQAKESMAKVAEADYLGRVMAHSYVDELDKFAAPAQLSTMGRLKELLRADKLRDMNTALHSSNRKDLIADFAKRKYNVEDALEAAKQMRRAEARKVRGARLGLVGGGALGAGGIGAGLGYLGSEKTSAYVNPSSLKGLQRLEQLVWRGGHVTPETRAMLEAPTAKFNRWATTKGPKAHKFSKLTGADRTAALKQYKEELTDLAASEAKKARGARLGLAGGGALGIGGAGAGLGYLGGEKTSSALTDASFAYAVKKAAQAGWDPGEAAKRISYVIDQGVGPTIKLAGATSVEDGVEIRAHELLEAAGYPIAW